MKREDLNLLQILERNKGDKFDLLVYSTYLSVSIKFHLETILCDRYRLLISLSFTNFGDVVVISHKAVNSNCCIAQFPGQSFLLR